MKVKQLFRLFIFIGVLLCSTAYAADVIDIPFSANSQLNLNAEGQAAPTEIVIYQLDSSANFTKKSFFALYDTPEKALGDALIKQQRFQILPNQKITVSVKLESDTQYVGILIGYNDLKGITWHTLIPAEDFDKNNIQVNLDTNGINLQKEKANRFAIKNGVYVELLGGFSSLAINDASYTTMLPAQPHPIATDYNFQAGAARVASGMAGLGAGYQWAITNKSDIGFLGLRSMSFGGSILTLNNMKIEGTSIATKSGSTFSNDLLRTNLQAAFVEAKLGILPFARIIPYFSLGIGMAQFTNTSYTQSTDTKNYTINEGSNSSTAFKTELGLDIYPSSNLAFGFGYQYLNVGSLTLINSPDTTLTYSQKPQIGLQVNSVVMRVRYIF